MFYPVNLSLPFALLISILGVLHGTTGRSRRYFMLTSEQFGPFWLVTHCCCCSKQAQDKPNKRLQHYQVLAHQVRTKHKQWQAINSNMQASNEQASIKQRDMQATSQQGVGEKTRTSDRLVLHSNYSRVPLRLVTVHVSPYLLGFGPQSRVPRTWQGPTGLAYR